MQIRETSEYLDWFVRLGDDRAQQKIWFSIERLAAGNPGQYRRLSGELHELKIDSGPGYRVYYTERGGELIVLLAGGNKSTHESDIEKAKRLAENLEN
jgi:putative addiction module killer protein